MRPSVVLALAIALFVASGSRESRADSFDIGDIDKQAHVATSYGLTLTGAVVLQRFRVRRVASVLISVAATLALGTLKELVIDDRFSGGDEIANLIGAGSAAGIVFGFRL